MYSLRYATTSNLYCIWVSTADIASIVDCGTLHFNHGISVHQSIGTRILELTFKHLCLISILNQQATGSTFVRLRVE
jgi:hypothetical protein